MPSEKVGPAADKRPLWPGQLTSPPTRVLSAILPMLFLVNDVVQINHIYLWHCIFSRRTSIKHLQYVHAKLVINSFDTGHERHAATGNRYGGLIEEA